MRWRPGGDRQAEVAAGALLRAEFGRSWEQLAREAASSSSRARPLDEQPGSAARPRQRCLQPTRRRSIAACRGAPADASTKCFGPTPPSAHHDTDFRPALRLHRLAAAGCARSAMTSPSSSSTYPSGFKVIRHVRPKLACVACQGIFQAEAARESADRSWHRGPRVARPCHGLEVFADIAALPAGRIYAREGVDLDLSTMADWVGPARGCPEPLIDAIAAACWPRELAWRRHACAGAGARHRQDQDRTILGLRARRPAVRRPGPPAAPFFYSPDRGGEHPRHLETSAASSRPTPMPGSTSSTRAAQARADHRGGLLGASMDRPLSARQIRHLQRSRSCAAIHSALRRGARPQALMIFALRSLSRSDFVSDAPSGLDGAR